MAWSPVGDRPVRVGMAGLGRFGKLHAGVLGHLPGATIVAAYDPDPEQGQIVRERTGAELVGSFTDLLARTDLDCVYIVTPEDLHVEQARLAIARGLPIFIEKPLATTSADCDEIVRLAREAGVYVQVGFVLRFETQHSHLKAQIASGKFGEIVTIRAKRHNSRAWFPIYSERAHIVYETMVHDIDLLLWFLGQPCEKVYAAQRHVSGASFPDTISAMLQFRGGAIANLETTWLIPGRAPANVVTEDWFGTIDAELEVIGTRRTARLRILESGLEIWTDEVPEHHEPGLWPVVDGRVRGALREEDEHFIECVRTATPSRVASIEDAAAGIRIAEAIVESATSGREIVLA